MSTTYAVAILWSALLLAARVVSEDVDAVQGPIVKLHVVDAVTSVKPPAQEPPGNSIAKALETVLAKEFGNGTLTKPDTTLGSLLNTTNAAEEATVETVVRISSRTSTDGSSATDSSSTAEQGSLNHAASSSAVQSAAGADGVGSSGVASSTEGLASNSSQPLAVHETLPVVHAEPEVERIITRDHAVFVLSQPSEGQASLTLDPQLITDLTYLLAAAAVCGVVAEALRMPAMNGYLVAGAILGPGGLHLVQELVQVETLAQLGVSLMLFGLGMELSPGHKLGGVAVGGGALQVVGSMGLGALVALGLGAEARTGAFVGGLLAMSSTSIVVKSLESSSALGTVYGQITVSTLVTQDVFVGVFFALAPLFARKPAVASQEGRSEALGQAVVLIIGCMCKLLLALLLAWVTARLLLRPVLRGARRSCSPELQQLLLVGICVTVAWLCGRAGLSSELGSILAGVMVSMACGQPQRPSSSVNLGDSSNGSAHSLGPTAQEWDKGLCQGGVGGVCKASGPPGACLPNGCGGAGQCGGLNSSLAPKDWDRHSSVKLDMGPLMQAPAGTMTPHPGTNKDGGSGGGMKEQLHHAGLSPEVAQARHSIHSVTGVMGALFLASIGLLLSPSFLFAHLHVLALGALSLTLVKSSLIAVVVRWFGFPWRTAWAVGGQLAHVGEFAFILLSIATQLQILSPQVYQLLLGVTALSLLATPPLAQAAIRVLRLQ